METYRSRIRALARWLRSDSVDRRTDEASDAAASETTTPARSALRHCFEFQSRQVIALLEERGGWAWQSDLVEETGWSRPKTSRVLTRMEEDADIDRYRFGRQKVVCFPDQDPRELPKQRE